MDAWAQLLWDRTPESDAHRNGARSPYEGRDTQAVQQLMFHRKLRITDFVSQYAIGDNLAASGELLVRSRQLLADSRAQILKCQMRLVMSRSGKSVQ